MAQRLDTVFSRVLLDGKAGFVVPAAALESIIQQQLVHGGTLDTLLLETGLLDEEQVHYALSLAWGTGAVEAAALESPDPAAVKLLPERLATALGTAPFAVDAEQGGALHVACRGPLDQELIDELAGLIRVKVIPHVVAEVRVWQGLQRAYGAVLDGRFVALLRQLAHEATTPADRGRTLRDTNANDPPLCDLAEALARLAAEDSRDGIARVATNFARQFLPFAAVFGVRVRGDEATCLGWHRQGPVEGALFGGKPFIVPDDCLLKTTLAESSAFLGKPQPTDGNTAFLGWLGRRRPKTVLAIPIIVARRPVAVLFGDGGIRPREAAEVRELLLFSERLGPAFENLLRQRHSAQAQTPNAEAVVPRANTQPQWAASPLEDPPAPMTAEIAAADLAPPGDVAVDVAPDATPVVTDTVATAVADSATTPPTSLPHRDGTSPFARSYVAPSEDQADGVKSTLFAVDDTIAPAAWQGALLATVEQGLQGGTVNDPTQRPPVDSEWDDTGWEQVVYDPAHANELNSSPFRSTERIEMSFPELSTAVLAGLDAAPPAAAVAPGGEPLSTLSHNDVVELLFAGDEALVFRSVRELVGRGLACVPALSERFPGRLRVDPFDPGENVRTAFRLGAVVDVLAQLGADGLDAAIPHIDSRHPAHRFAAVLLFALTPDPRAIDLLRSRLHDQEPRIRQLAAEALMPFLAHHRFETLLSHLRERTSSSLKPYPLQSRRRAVELLGQFRDVSAIPLLVALLSTELAEPARQALRSISLQDHGARPKGWEKWWAKAKKRSRLDWLIEALSSEELDLRSEAHRELQSLAGDDFGYRPDADKRSRQRAVEVWQQWWFDEKARAPQPAAIART